MSAKISPLAPKAYAKLAPIEGVAIATAEAGIKYRNRTDLVLMTFAEGTEVAGVFTRSKCPSAPVDLCRANLAGGKARVLVVNSGNANAFTGRKGRESTRMTAEAAAKAAGCKENEVFLASTGVIGEPLDAGRFAHLLQGLAADAEPGRWGDAGKAIMTTDTYPKYATATAMLGGVEVTINGIAKGAGMIAPDMATMLSFVATDAPIAAPVLQALLSAATAKTFNAVTVDSDTSTSDTLLLFATGSAARRGAPRIAEAKDTRLAPFRRALNRVLKSLALHIDADPAVPERLLADATRVKQILFNLLSNAIKFSERGAVVLDVRLRSDAQGRPQLAFVVTDTGVGMDAATLDKLFNRFAQGDSSPSRRHGGAGLGLEISRNLARLMGGDIRVASAPGAGSTFTLTLPVAAP